LEKRQTEEEEKKADATASFQCQDISNNKYPQQSYNLLSLCDPINDQTKIEDEKNLKKEQEVENEIEQDLKKNSEVNQEKIDFKDVRESQQDAAKSTVVPDIKPESDENCKACSSCTVM